MDYARALSFFLDDPKWKTKTVIGSGLVLASMALSIVLVGLLGFAILGGYSMRLLQNVRDGKEHPLPEWDNWGGDLLLGLKYAVVAIVWALPVFVFMILYFGSVFAMAGIGSTEYSAAGMAIMPLLYCILSLVVVYSLMLTVFSPGFTIALAQDEHIGSGFQFGEIWRWTRSHLGQVLIVALLLIGGGSVIGQIAFYGGLLMCFIGLIVTVPLSVFAYSIFAFHLYGQLAGAYAYGASDIQSTSIQSTVEEPTGLTAAQMNSDSIDESHRGEPNDSIGGDEPA